MKGGTDEEKMMGPLFPRLHVNDTEKGGPRAPPRNKMALYEQLSIPSQRFNSSASTLPLPPHNASSVVPSTSSGQGDGNERNFFSPFYMPSHTPAHLTEKIHTRSSDGMNSNTTTKLERRSVKNPSKNKHITSNGECSSFHPHYFSSSKSSCRQKLGEEEDDFRVPTYVHTDTVLSPNKDQTGGDTELLTPFHKKPGQLAVIPTSTPQKNVTAPYNSPFKLQNIHDKVLNQTNAANIKSQLHAQYQSEPRRNDTAIIKGITERSAAQPHCREQTVVQEHPSASVNVLDTSHDGNKDVSQEINAKLLSKNDIHHSGICGKARCLTGNGTAKAENGTRVRSESCCKASSGNGNRSPNQAENCSNETEGKACWPAQVEDADETDDVSESSMVDSVSGLDIYPDDVVGIIGQKQFWKARKAIVNQQRVFSVQVFELHRLIKVQKLIAGSPHLLLEEYPYLGRPPPKVAAKKPSSEHSLKSQPSITKPKNDSPKPSQNIECPAESTVSKPSQPSLDNTVNKGLVSQVPTCGPYSGNPLPVPVAADSRSNPWCFHPPGNQWLVPVVSPSEGLVYKPYMGPCPPAGSFMAPIYGGCGPIPMPVPAYGFPASHQQPGIGVVPGAPAVAPNYFPSPCGLPMMNPVIPTSAVEQANLSGGPRPHGQLEQVSTAEVNFNMHSRISCNMSNQKSEAFSCHVGKLQASKDSELQGSTGSSPCERANRRTPQITGGQDALPLFPMAPAIEDPNETSQAQSSDQQARVIKVVPHNPRSATESAARIFRSIQEERQQHDSL